MTKQTQSRPLGHYLSIALCILTLASCGISRSSQRPTEVGTSRLEQSLRKKTLDGLHLERSSWQGIKASLKGEIKSRGVNFSSRINLSAMKEVGIRLSVSPLPFVEVARVWFTPEGITIVDLINSRYVQERYATFSDILGFELTYAQVEALLLGHIFVPGDSKQTEGSLRSLNYAESKEGEPVLSGVIKDLLYYFQVNTEGGLRRFAVETKASHQLLFEAQYADRMALSATSSLPSQTILTAYREGTSQAQQLGQLSLQWTKAHESSDIDRNSLSPRIKGHYTRIMLEQIIKMIGAN